MPTAPPSAARRVRSSARAGVLLVLGLAAMAASAQPEDLPKSSDYRGTWAGTYVASQGATRVVLVVHPTTTQDFDGHFLFYPDPDNPDVPSGHYRIAGAVEPATGQLSFDGTEWVVRPPDYEFVGFVGGFGAEPGTLEGVVLYRRQAYLGTFTLRRLD